MRPSRLVLTKRSSRWHNQALGQCFGRRWSMALVGALDLPWRTDWLTAFLDRGKWRLSILTKMVLTMVGVHRHLIPMLLETPRVGIGAKTSRIMTAGVERKEAAFPVGLVVVMMNGDLSHSA